jgi:hypothetical protein
LSLKEEYERNDEFGPPKRLAGKNAEGGMRNKMKDNWSKQEFKGIKECKTY